MKKVISGRRTFLTVLILVFTSVITNISTAKTKVNYTETIQHSKLDTVKEISHEISKPNLLKYVNILQGTDSKFSYSHGNDCPYVGLPHGVNYWSAQTGKNGDGWKYKYSVKTIRGFDESHQAYTWGGPAPGVFSLMPVSGKLVVNESKRAAAFSHNRETGKPNYYGVTFKNGMKTEISPTERGAFFQFSFPRSKKAYVVFDGYTGMSNIKIHPDQHKMTGYVINGRRKYKNYFVITFSQPFSSYGTWQNTSDTTAAISKHQSAGEGKAAGAYVQFKKGATVQAKVTSSHISLDQAETTLDRELSSFNNISQVKKAGGKVWNKALSKIVVEGGSQAQKETFYSCLFRANLFPMKAYEIDENGNPRYYDPYNGKVYEGYNYSSIGFWDGFRSLFPLQNIISRDFEGRYTKSLITSYRHNEFFPGGGMIGNHVIATLADAWAKGIQSFNADSALTYYFRAVTGGNRPGYKPYFTKGYVSYPKGAKNSPGSTGQTLAYAYDDFCAYKLAKMTNNTFYERIFSRQMYNYKNVFDSTDNFMKGRYANGEWRKKFNPYRWGGPFVEGNAWQWTWAVWHDEQGLINLMGGDKPFAAKLNSLFAAPSDSVLVGGYGFMIHEMNEMVADQMGQYAGGNEPSFHIGYLYNYISQPWKTQKIVRQAMDKLFTAGPKGYPGDLDGGATAGWYVMSALGFYSVTPGTNQYVIGSPLFKKATITLKNGKKFTIEAPNNSPQNVYIQDAQLDGEAYEKNWISYKNIVNGGTLHFSMGNQPNRNRGIDRSARPFSLSNPK